MICKTCGEIVTSDMAFCGNCGTPVPAAGESSVCPNCSSPMAPDDVFCGNCGYKRDASAPSASGSVCPNCSSPMAPDDIFCGNCGYRRADSASVTPPPAVPAPDSVCPVCSSPMAPDDIFCGNCGYKRDDSKTGTKGIDETIRGVYPRVEKGTYGIKSTIVHHGTSDDAAKYSEGKKFLKNAGEL